MIIEGKRERLKEVEREGGGEGLVWWPWRCFRNLIASTFAYLHAVVSVCLCNGLPAGQHGNTRGALQQQRDWWGVNLLRVKQGRLEW